MKGKTLEEMGYQVIALEKLVKADWNYKEEDAAKTEKLIANIKRNGQVETIIVRELETGFFEVVNGNHRYDALKALGFTHVAAYNAGPITLAAAQRLAIETNETKFDTNTLQLGGIIQEILAEFDISDLLQTMPYNEGELTNLINLNAFDWEPPELETPEGEGPAQGGEGDDDTATFIIDVEIDEAPHFEPELRQLLERFNTAVLR